MSLGMQKLKLLKNLHRKSYLMGESYRLIITDELMAYWAHAFGLMTLLNKIKKKHYMISPLVTDDMNN